jgi:hypothetical protein
MRSALFALLLACSLGACSNTSAPEDHFSPPENLLALRMIQSRRFDTQDELEILRATCALLQDLGFEIDASDSEGGLVVASKLRSAVQGDEVALAMFFAILSGNDVPYNHRQKLRACVVTRPFGEKNESIAVRVTFQRIVWNTTGAVTIMEGLDQPEFYQEFFAKLSKSVFLEAHGI